MESTGKKFSLVDFFFSYEGTIGRLAYWGGTIVLGGMFWVIIFMWKLSITPPLADIFFYPIVFGVWLYSVLALMQKRCRSMGGSGTAYISVFVLSVWADCVLEAFQKSGVENSLFEVVVGLLNIGCCIIGLILLFSKPKENLDMSQRSVLLKYPLSFCIVSIVSSLSSYFIVIHAINSAVERDLGEVKTSQRSADHDLFFAANYIYRNVVGYEEFCRKHGYDMTHLPDAFSTEFAAEIEVVDREMSLHGGTLKSFLDYMRKDEGAEAEREIAAEFEYARKELILQNVAEEEGVSVKNLQWSAEYNDRMTMAEVCSYIDREGTDLLPMDSGPAKQKFYLIVKQLKQWQ